MITGFHSGRRARAKDFSEGFRATGKSAGLHLIQDMLGQVISARLATDLGGTGLMHGLNESLFDGQGFTLLLCCQESLPECRSCADDEG